MFPHPHLPAVLYWPRDSSGKGSGGYGARVTCALCGHQLRGVHNRIAAFRLLHQRGVGDFHLGLIRNDLEATGVP